MDGELSNPSLRELEVALRTRDLVKAESCMLPMPQVECSVLHHFGPGLYVREVHMPAGTLAIGHYQKFEHLNVFLKGRVLLMKDDGTTEEMAAPMMYVGKPGRKAGVVLEDVIWQNVYATEETNIEKLESHFLGKSDQFLDHQDSRIAAVDMAGDRADYSALLTEYGISHEMVREQSENRDDQCPFPFGAWRVKTGCSSIEGTGLFATSPISGGDMIAPARIGGKRTPAGRYTNHSKSPNARMVILPNGDIHLVALRSIGGCFGGQDGEEITIDYRQALGLSGVRPLGEEKCQQ